ncbi:MAG: EVE domain-containing protein, partial [Elusimicrobiota bacterium]
MKAMKRGDLGFFHHTGDVKAVVGIVEVIGEAHPESKDAAWQCVDLAARQELPQPVTLAAVKADP